MDLTVLSQIADELDATLRGRRIDQVYALPRNDVVLVAGRRSEPRLWLSTEADHPHLYLRPGFHPTPDRPPGFAMAGRNLLKGRRVANIRCLPGERIIEITCGGPEPVRLVFEAIPRRATILVLDADDVVRAAWQPRKGRPGLGEAYVPPPPDNRPATDTVDEEIWAELESATDFGVLVRGLLRSVAGITPLSARDVAWLRLEGADLRTAVQERLSATDAPAPCIYSPAPLDTLDAPPPARRFVLAPHPLVHMDREDDAVRTDFDTMLEAAAVYFPLRASLRALGLSRTALESALHDGVARLQRTRDAVAGDAVNAGKADRHRTWADLLLAFPDAARDGDTVVVADPYEPGEEIAIRINPALSSVDNAQRYYQRARRAERSVERTTARRQELQERITRLNDMLANLRMVRSVVECQSIARAARRLGINVDDGVWLTPEADARGSASPPVEPRTQRPSTPAQDSGDPGIDAFTAADGSQILVGRNAGANERLTHKMAAPHDFWLHAEGPGSHVVIRNPTRNDHPAEDALREAASLAAFYSRSRGATKVNVRWTEVRHVKKPRGAPTGQVVLRQSRTVLAQPLPPEELFAPSNE